MQYELLEDQEQGYVAESYYAPRPLWSMLRTWSLLIPLMYLATAGGFMQINQQSSGGFTGLSDAQTAFARAVQAVVWAWTAAVMFPFYQQIVNAIIRYKNTSMFIGLAYLSVLWSPDTIDALRRATLLALTIVFAYFFTEVYEPEEQMKLIFGVGTLAVLGSLAVVVVLPDNGLGPDGAWRGIFDHKNACDISVCFLVMPYFFRKSMCLLERSYGALIVMGGLLLVYECESRTAWILAASFVAYYALFKLVSRFQSRDGISVLLVILAVVPPALYYGYKEISNIAYLVGKDPTLTNRTLIWGAVMGAISKRPIFGYGYGGFWNQLQGESAAVLLQVGALLTHAHNGYLNVWLQLGVVGLGVLGWNLVMATKDAVRCFAVMRSRAAGWYVGILIVILVGNTVESFLLQYNALSTVLFVVACVGLRKIARGEVAQ